MADMVKYVIPGLFMHGQWGCGLHYFLLFRLL